MEQTILIPIKDIQDNPYQHREHEDPAAVEEIAISIFRNGLQQYPAVRAVNSHYELVYGHTRKAAYQLLATRGVPTAEIKADKSFAQIPVYVRDLTDRQMFELAIVENLKRRDPKPTEKARAIQKYMTEFNATSKEAGELFGMNDATARGMVRLLDLAPEAQVALDEGKITQGTARTLLSMQKIAPSAVITATINKIEKNKGNALPDEVIEDTIERLDNVVDMWNEDHRDGKPRAGYEGWLLDMKNFPNHLLPALTKEESALDAEKREHLINPPACTACPFYTKVRGSHYCGVKICHTRKTVAWKSHLIEQASKQLGIAIYASSDGSYRVLSYEHGTLFKNKDKGLRLILVPQGNRVYQGFQGVNDNAFCVVATGSTIDKMGSRGGSVNQGVGGKKTEKEKAEMRAMKIYRRRRKEMMWECTAVAKVMFDGVPLNVLERLCAWHFVGIDDRIPDEYEPAENAKADVKADFQRRAVIWRLITEGSSHYRRDTMASILKDLQEYAQVKPTKALIQRAQEWDAEISAVAKGVAHSVAVETKGKK